MLKFLRNKIQSLTETQLNVLTAVLVLINLGIVIFWISFFISLPKITPPPSKEKSPLTEEITEETWRPGEVGEIEENNQVVAPEDEIAFFIQNTTGIIQEIKEDRITIQGDGQNFADRKPRLLTVLFTGDTVTQRLGGENQQIGFDGLKQLKPEMSVLISTIENIRGKIEFEADIINIL